MAGSQALHWLLPHEEPMKNTASSEATGHHISTTWDAKFFKGGSLRRQLKANLSQAKQRGDENGREKRTYIKM